MQLGAADFNASQVLTGFSDTFANMNVASTQTPSDVIDLTGVANANVTSTNLSGTTITVKEGATTVASLTLTSAPGAGVHVDWAKDAGTGTDIFLTTVACYCRGTLIRTASGEVAVEELAIGDRVMTLSGEAKPIRWIGRRVYDGRFIAGNRAVLPIRVAAGAIADGVPARDLFLSPTHALYIDGVLAPAEYLVNGASIAQAESVDEVEYFHIELAAHDVIFAEGAPAESYVDCDNRGIFQNADEFAALYPEDDRAGRPAGHSQIADREFLGERVAKLEQRFGTGVVPAPPGWGGSRLRPETLEFLQSCSNQLHDRLQYSRRSDGRWTIERLAP